MATERAPLVRLPDPPDTYSPEQQAQFKVETERALQDIAQSVQRVSATDPTALSSGDNDDYAVGRNTTTARLTPASGGSNITGIAGGTDGRQLRIINIGSDPLTLEHQDTASDAANRLLAPSASGLTIVQNEAVDLEYDANEQRWRILRPVEPKILSYTFSVVDNTGTGADDYSVGWTVSAAVYDTKYNMEIWFYRENFLRNTNLDTSPVASPSYSVSMSSLSLDGDGVSDTHQLKLELQIAATGEIIDSVFASVESTVV